MNSSLYAEIFDIFHSKKIYPKNVSLGISGLEYRRGGEHAAILSLCAVPGQTH